MDPVVSSIINKPQLDKSVNEPIKNEEETKEAQKQLQNDNYNDKSNLESESVKEKGYFFAEPGPSAKKIKLCSENEQDVESILSDDSDFNDSSDSDTDLDDIINEGKPKDFFDKIIMQEPLASVKKITTADEFKDDDYDLDIKEKLKEMGEISFESVKKGDSSKTKQQLEPGDPEVVNNAAKKNEDEAINIMERKANMRRNIREVMDETQLEESTLAAQREEVERLRRLQEQQRLMRQMNQDRVLSLIQGNEFHQSDDQATSAKFGNTILTKLPNGQVRRPLELTKIPKSAIPPHQKPKPINIPSSTNYYSSETSITPSVSIAPINRRPPTPNYPSDSDDTDYEEHHMPGMKERKVDVIDISSDEDDCVVVSDAENDGTDDVEDPTNSGMHTNDEFNQPDEQGRVVINIGHPDDEEDIYLAPQLSRLIKPHQIGGIRFLFDNIIESTSRYQMSSGFGCILAHSMGLGKTLQVITFADIFLRHTPAKTILCIMPINTLQNWLAEFNTWLPTEENVANSSLLAHGEVRPRNFNLFVLNDSHKTLTARARVIHEWKTTGGVLLIGYEQFRLLSLRRSPKSRSKKLETRIHDDDRNKALFDDVHEALVKPGPDLVICDEGHRIKNSHASISQALKQMVTKRRVVLTGYPLQNNLMEYWCMVDFVRPNYLGTKTEFCNMFERPIQNGQCIDSTEEDIKLMRYRAHVLHSLLLGFVQRRSHRVLQAALPAKQEYVLLLRMTTFQRSLYETFMNEVVRSQNVPNPLKAFAVCCKIWNHPDVLYDFIKKQDFGGAVDIDLEEVSNSITTTDKTKLVTKKARSKKVKPAASVTPYNSNANHESLKANDSNSNHFNPSLTNSSSHNYPNPAQNSNAGHQFGSSNLLVRNNVQTDNNSHGNNNSMNNSIARSGFGNPTQSYAQNAVGGNYRGNFPKNNNVKPNVHLNIPNPQAISQNLQQQNFNFNQSSSSASNNMFSNTSYLNQPAYPQNNQHQTPQHQGSQHQGPQHPRNQQGPPHQAPQHQASQHQGPQHQGSQHQGPQQQGTQHQGPQTAYSQRNFSNSNFNNQNYQSNSNNYSNASQNYWNQQHQQGQPQMHKVDNYYNNFRYDGGNPYEQNQWAKEEPPETENKPKINIISDINLSRIYNNTPASSEKKFSILSDIKLEPKKEEPRDDVKPCFTDSKLGFTDVKPNFARDDSKGDVKLDAKMEKIELDDEKTTSTVKSASNTKEDSGIPYDWAIELLKDYIPGCIENSAKMQILFSIIKESIALGDRLLVFSQSLITLDLIEKFLQMNVVPGCTQRWAKNQTYYRLDGSTAALEREKLINEFNSNSKIYLFLVSTRAGSLGINLIGANRVVVLDASWNPCHDTQAVCRVYRYGQRKPCFVYRLVVDKCLEKKIYDRQINKQGMSDRVVDECNPDAHLTIKDVTSLCWDDGKETEEKDYSYCKDKYVDKVLQKVLEKHGRSFNQEPFQHESLLIDRKDKQLSSIEKRMAKRGYEREKQASRQPTYYNNANLIRQRPVASVRPMQQGPERSSRWIPAEHWQRQGMTAQEMTLPLDVVIPVNQPDKSNIVLKAGQKVLVLKSPKGVYMQLESGKIVAIKTAMKVRGKSEDEGSNAKTPPPPATNSTQIANNSPAVSPRRPFNPAPKVNPRGRPPSMATIASMQAMNRHSQMNRNKSSFETEGESRSLEDHHISSEDERSMDKRLNYSYAEGRGGVQKSRSGSDDGEMRSEEDSVGESARNAPQPNFGKFNKQPNRRAGSTLQQLEKTTSAIISESKQPFQETLNSITNSYRDGESQSSQQPSIPVDDDTPDNRNQVADNRQPQDKKNEVPPAPDYAFNNYYGYNVQPYAQAAPPPPPPQAYISYPQPPPYELNVYPQQQQPPPYNYAAYPQVYPTQPSQYPHQPYEYPPPPPAVAPPPQQAVYPPYSYPPPPQQYPPPQPQPQPIYHPATLTNPPGFVADFQYAPQPGPPPPPPTYYNPPPT